MIMEIYVTLYIIISFEKRLKFLKIRQNIAAVT